MRNFFEPAVNGNVAVFVLFSKEHILFIVSIVFLIFLMFLFREKLKLNKNYYKNLLIFTLVFSEGSLHIWRLSIGKWSLQTSLPFHLCGISIILTIIMLLTKNYFIFELTYFWGLIGGAIAIVTPALDVDYTHYRFWQFLVAHGVIILGVLYMVWVEDYYITYKSIWKTFIITNFIMLIIAVINILLGANYLYLFAKPISSSKTLYDFLGPWPWYLVIIEFLAILTFHLWYIPFYYKSKVNIDKKKKVNNCVGK